jgi:nucleotide-binding universal stress UspA family protein
MSYKTVLVHVDQGRDVQARVAVAAQVALANDGHLVGAAMTGISPYVFAAAGLNPAVPPLLMSFDGLRQEAAQALEAFEQQSRALGVASFEKRQVEDQAGPGMSMQARYADLLVISQADRASPAPRLRADFPEYVLFNCARPVLVVPAGMPARPVGRRVMVGWNGSREATRALTSAIPLLKGAEQVEVAVLNPELEGDMHGPLAGAEIALFLARHGIRVEVRTLSGVGDVGASLLSLAGDGGADLLVMGAYGSSRIGEILLGGATRTVLASARLALWMAR